MAAHNITDINGRHVHDGDLVRIYHYKDRRTGRHCYMYKLVIQGRLVDVRDIEKVGLDNAHRCNLDAEPFEIIDGGDYKECWYERPKHRKRFEVTE